MVKHYHTQKNALLIPMGHNIMKIHPYGIYNENTRYILIIIYSGSAAQIFISEPQSQVLWVFLFVHGYSYAKVSISKETLLVLL